MDSPLQGSKALFYFKRTLGLILLLALAATFFYSAYTKSGVEFKGFFLTETANSANAFDSFQWTFLDLGINNMMVSGVIARLMVGLELLLGLFLLFHIYLKKFTYKAIIAVLAIFIMYLFIVIIKQGNTGNCGCFGNKITMTPLNAIWKNLGMIAATAILMYIYPVKPYKHQEYVCMFLGLVGFCTPFLVNQMYTGTEPVAYKHEIDLNPLYKYEPTPKTDLRKGKQIIAFMSLTCPHCKKAAYLMQIIYKQHPEIPLFLVLDGPDTYQKKFFDDTHAEQVPHLFYNHTEDFEAMLNAGLKQGEKSGVPAIYWINNSVIEYKSVYAYYQLDPSYMLKWLKH